MNKLKLSFFILMMVFVAPAWGQSKTSGDNIEIQASSGSAAEDEEQYQLLSEGRRLLEAQQPLDAITGYFDKVIAYFQSKYEGRNEKIYCARTKTEELMYLLMAANEKREAIAISSLWADAYFMKGFALFDLERIVEAKQNMEQAISFSPSNSQYLSEMGAIHRVEKDWVRSLEFYQKAEEAAESSPENAKKAELGVALRGAGYVLVEMGELDKAEEKYRKCLEIDPGDNKARAGLGYIRKVKNNK